MSEEKKPLTIDEVKTNYGGHVRMAVIANPMYNGADIAFIFYSRDGKRYYADFSSVEFREITENAILRTWDSNDAIRVSADHLKVPIDQLLYAAGLNGLCETSANERDAYKAHIADLKATNDRLLKMIEVRENE